MPQCLPLGMACDGQWSFSSCLTKQGQPHSPYGPENNKALPFSKEFSTQCTPCQECLKFVFFYIVSISRFPIFFKSCINLGETFHCQGWLMIHPGLPMNVIQDRLGLALYGGSRGKPNIKALNGNSTQLVISSYGKSPCLLRYR